MATSIMPFGGSVEQAFRMWTAAFHATGSQIGLINVSYAKSSAPEVEQEVLAEVGSYGKQLGRVGDALIVLLAHFKPERPLNAEETKAIGALQTMLDEIADVKQRHDRRALRP